MPHFQITGTIMPSNFKLTLPLSLETKIELMPATDNLTISTRITNGTFVADCYINTGAQDIFSGVLGYMQDFLSSQLLLLTFGSGTVFYAVPQEVSYNHGPKEALWLTCHNVSDLFPNLNADTSGQIDTANFASIIHLLWTDRGLITAARDFHVGLVFGTQRIVNCTRAIEAMRNSMFGKNPENNEREAAWSLFRTNLAISKAFINTVIDRSKSIRHGGMGMILGDADNIVIERTTMIFSRFFYFKLHGNAPLTGPEFPEL